MPIDLDQQKTRCINQRACMKVRASGCRFLRRRMGKKVDVPAHQRTKRDLKALDTGSPRDVRRHELPVSTPAPAAAAACAWRPSRRRYP